MNKRSVTILNLALRQANLERALDTEATQVSSILLPCFEVRKLVQYIFLTFSKT